MGKDRAQQSRGRLPRGVVEKLVKNSGGGTHQSRKGYDRKRDKHQFRKQVNESE